MNVLIFIKSNGSMILSNQLWFNLLTYADKRGMVGRQN